ncbi:hypothetical protein ABK040_006016 [Willaertia magna]
MNTNNPSETNSNNTTNPKDKGIPKTLKDLLKSEYSEVTREAIQKKYKQEAKNLPLKTRIEAKLQSFYGEDVGAKGLEIINKGLHENKFNRGATPLQKKILYMFLGSLIFGNVFYFTGRYIYNNFVLNSKESNLLKSGNIYYGRDPKEFDKEVYDLANQMILDYKRGLDREITEDEKQLILRDAGNRISYKYAQERQFMGSSVSNPNVNRHLR